MKFQTIRSIYCAPAFFLCLLAGISALPAQTPDAQSSSSNLPAERGAQAYTHESTPSLVDPAGPTISLTTAEPLFVMSTALNMCGYDEGLSSSAPVRLQVRNEIEKALAASEDARAKRDALCLYIAQHRMTGTILDVSQYISLSLYLTPPPEIEATAAMSEMPPDATQVAEIVPHLKDFADAVDLHGIWLTVHRTFDQAADQLHDELSQMVVSTNLYLKMPAGTYDGRRFIVVVDPMLSPSTVNARIYGTDYVVVVSPLNGKIRMTDVRHTYLHYVIEPLLFARSNAIDRTTPILKEIREAPLEFRYRSDTVALTVECLIKAIEARTMDTGIPPYKIPAGVERSQLPRYQHEQQLVEQKQEAVRVDAMRHDMKQGFVLTQYFYDQMIQFEKEPSGLKDTIGEMVYSMDVDQQVHRTRQTEFDKEADAEVLGRAKPHKLMGMELAESKLSGGDVAGASTMAKSVLAHQSDTLDSATESAHAYFILARAAMLTAHAEDALEDFQKTLATSKEPRLLAWSHIYLGRMLDLECKRDAAVAEYKEALKVRDGQQDTRLAAERGAVTSYAVQRGHSCDEDADDEPPAKTPDSKPATGNPFPGDAPKP
jgi:hypothetical protein